MKCEICGRGMREGVTLIRQNEKGVIGLWRCRLHNNVPIDPITDELTKIIEANHPTKRTHGKDE